MRRLLLIRHAKSSWKYSELDDHERPLNKRGERDALAMARYLQEQDDALDVIYSSTATRALDYAQSISTFCNVGLEPDLSFYTFNSSELMEILRNLPDSAMRVAVVAHNPAITQVVNQLSAAEIANVPTSAVAFFDCDIDSWRDLTDVPGTCKLDCLLSPKELNANPIDTHHLFRGADS